MLRIPYHSRQAMRAAWAGSSDIRHANAAETRTLVPRFLVPLYCCSYNAPTLTLPLVADQVSSLVGEFQAKVATLVPCTVLLQALSKSCLTLVYI
jgi:hypothetical protein